MKTLCRRLAEGIIVVSFWNLENYFSWNNTTLDRTWTRSMFNEKTRAISKSILWMSDTLGRMPDAIGFAEVDSIRTTRQIARSDFLYRSGYAAVQYDSPDPRGIDCALLYRISTLRLVCSKPCRIDSVRTRDILLAQFIQADGDSLAILVNHHPSKYGGGRSSRGRELAVRRLKQVTDSLYDAGWRRQVVLGDFNDTPDKAVYDTLEEHLVNLSEPLWRKGEGTIRYQGEWQLIDQGYTTKEMDAEMKIIRVPFLMERDRKHSGQKPRRTFNGPRYNAGVSDHLPIAIILKN